MEKSPQGRRGRDAELVMGNAQTAKIGASAHKKL